MYLFTFKFGFTFSAVLICEKFKDIRKKELVFHQAIEERHGNTVSLDGDKESIYYSIDVICLKQSNFSYSLYQMGYIEMTLGVTAPSSKPYGSNARTISFLHVFEAAEATSPSACTHEGHTCGTGMSRSANACFVGA